MKERPEDAEDRLEIDEIVMRICMAVGVLILGLAAAAGMADGKLPVFYAYGIATLLALGVFAIGWYYERVASAALGIAVGALIAWGIVAGWETGVWLTVGTIVIVPTLVVAGLLLFADHEEEVIDHAEHAGPTHAVHA